MKKVLTLILILVLCACSQATVVISSNDYVQTDYDYDCLSGDKTFSEIIVCYQKENSAERSQNKITNELILKNNK